MKTTRRALGVILAGIAAVAIFGCGGGGGGGGSSAPPATAVGKVLFLSNGLPVTGAKVSIGGKSFTTLADGLFTLTNVPSNATTLTVTGTGVKPLTQSVTLVPAGTTNVVNDLGDIDVLESTSADAYTANLSGQVVRADTFAPIAGATIIVNGQTATSDSSGNFTISGLPVGLGASRNGTNPIIGIIRAVDPVDNKPFVDHPISTTGLGLGPGDNPLGAIPMAKPATITPPPPFNITGKISLQGQTVLSGTTVTLINKATGATVGSPVTTDTTGSYGFFVVAGTYTVKAEHPGPPAFTTQTKDVTLFSPDTVQTVNMTLVP